MLICRQLVRNFAEYRTQMDVMNQHALNMQRLAESQKKDFEAEIEKLRREQKQLIRNLKSQPLEGTPGLENPLWTRTTRSEDIAIFETNY